MIAANKLNKHTMVYMCPKCRLLALKQIGSEPNIGAKPRESMTLIEFVCRICGWKGKLPTDHDWEPESVKGKKLYEQLMQKTKEKLREKGLSE